MATNELGHQLASAHDGQATLGAYRRGNRTPWIPGALIDVWVPCARGDVATGVPYPHVYFVQTLGERSAEAGSIHCLACRAELADRKASGSFGASKPASSQKASPPSQSALPF